MKTKYLKNYNGRAKGMHFVNSDNQIYQIIDVIRPPISCVDLLEMRYFDSKESIQESSILHQDDRKATPKQIQKFRAQEGRLVSNTGMDGEDSNTEARNKDF